MPGEETSRVEELARKATVLLDTGDVEKAAQLLREAGSIDPENENVKKAWDLVRQEEQGHSLVKYCQKWLAHQKEEDGEEAVDYMHRHQLSFEVAEEAMEVMLQYNGEADIADEVTGELLKHAGARKPVARALIDQPTITFNQMFDRGDDSMSAITTMMLEKISWPTEKERIAAVRDAFQLALAQMMHAGQDYPERAMKVISRLLGVESHNLNGLIDADGFDVILSQLDIRAPNILRSQATLATLKLLELAPESAQQLISQYVVKRVQKPTPDGLVLAFSAAASVFPMAPQAASQLFLSPGFVEAFVPLVKKWKSQRLEQAALELLSAACIDKPCREAMRKALSVWLKGVVDHSMDKKRSEQAALILVKIKDAVPEGEEQKISENTAEDQDQLVRRFRSIVISNDGTDKQHSIEGLAYASIDPKVKEELAKDDSFIKGLIRELNSMESGKAALFGGLNIIANLTTYLPVQTEEQQKMSQLKAYANSTKPKEPDVLDNDQHVAERCKRVMNADVIPLLVKCGRKASTATQNLILQILVSLSKDKSHRGKMAQQGAVKLLLQLYDNLSSPSTSTDPPTPQQDTLSRTAAHALARILISTNPSHVFGSSGASLTSAIRPLTTLLTPSPSEDPPTLLPVYESLLALTNLASTPAAPAPIIRHALAALEDLLLSSNAAVQRAATELACNLSAAPPGAALFADGSPAAARRVHVLVALADAHDLGTRRAAAGALAMISGCEGGAAALLAREGALRVVLGLVGEESDEVRHRGVVVLANLVGAAGGVGERAVARIREEGGVRVVGEMVQKTRVREILQVGLEVLTALN